MRLRAEQLAKPRPTFRWTHTPCGSCSADPHLVARDFARQLGQPGLPAPIPAENTLCRAEHLPGPGIRPAPFMGQHTYEIAAGLLGLPDTQIRSLLASGVLEAPAPGTPQPER